MSRETDPLDRLLRSAAQSEPVEVPGPAHLMEAKVLAVWRSVPAADVASLLVFWLRRAVALACVLVLLSAVWSFRQAVEPAGDAASLADAAVQTALNYE